MMPDFCDECPKCSVEYEARIQELEEELARIQKAQAKLLLEQVGLKAKIEAFKVGKPITYMKDNTIILEYPDGRIEHFRGD